MRLFQNLVFGTIAAGLIGACTQTFEASDGSTRTSNISPVVANVQSARDVVAAQELAVDQPSARYRSAVQLGEVTGFDSPGVFPRRFSPVTNSEARDALGGLLRENGFSPGSRYVLSVRLAEPGNPTGGATQTANALIEFTLRTTDGRTIKTETLRSEFIIPFKVAISGSLRAKLAFAGSFKNSIAKFLNGLG